MSVEGMSLFLYPEKSNGKNGSAFEIDFSIRNEFIPPFTVSKMRLTLQPDLANS